MHENTNVIIQQGNSPSGDTSEVVELGNASGAETERPNSFAVRLEDITTADLERNRFFALLGNYDILTIYCPTTGAPIGQRYTHEVDAIIRLYGVERAVEIVKATKGRTTAHSLLILDQSAPAMKALYAEHPAQYFCLAIAHFVRVRSANSTGSVENPEHKSREWHNSLIRVAACVAAQPIETVREANEQLRACLQFSVRKLMLNPAWAKLETFAQPAAIAQMANLLRAALDLALVQVRTGKKSLADFAHANRGLPMFRHGHESAVDATWRLLMASGVNISAPRLAKSYTGSGKFDGTTDDASAQARAEQNATRFEGRIYRDGASAVSTPQPGSMAAMIAAARAKKGL